MNKLPKGLDKGVTDVPLFTAPPQRKPLSNEELDRLWREPMSAGGWLRSAKPPACHCNGRAPTLPRWQPLTRARSSAR